MELKTRMMPRLSLLRLGVFLSVCLSVCMRAYVHTYICVYVCTYECMTYVFVCLCVV